MAPLHRPRSVFEHYLSLMREELPRAALSDCVEDVLDLLSQRVEGLPEVELESPIQPDLEPTGDDIGFLVVCLAQAAALERAVSGNTPRLLYLLANPENFDIDYLAHSEDEDEEGYNEVLDKPAVLVWAEISDDGDLELFWDDSEDESYHEPPVADPDHERDNRLLTLPAQLWQVGLPSDATPVQHKMASLVPATLLGSLTTLVHCLSATCDLRVDEWPSLQGEGLWMEDAEERFFRHLREQVAQTRRSVAVVTEAANKALAKNGLAGIKQFAALKKSAKKDAKSLAAAISAQTGKACSAGDIRQLNAYLQHVDEANKLLRALHAVGHRYGLSKKDMEDEES